MTVFLVMHLKGGRRVFVDQAQITRIETHADGATPGSPTQPLEVVLRDGDKLEVVATSPVDILYEMVLAGRIPEGSGVRPLTQDGL